MFNQPELSASHQQLLAVHRALKTSPGWSLHSREGTQGTPWPAPGNVVALLHLHYCS